MKIVKTFRGKKTIIKDVVQKNKIANSVNNSIARVNADSQRSNEVSYMAGQKASSIQRDMANAIAMQEGPVRERRDVTGELREAATYPPGYRDTLAERVVPSVEVPTIRAEEGPTRMRPMRGYSPLGMAGETNIVDRSRLGRGTPESYARGDPSAITKREPTIRVDDAYEGDPEVGFGRSGKNFFGEGQVGFRYGGAVTPKRKKRKKRLYKGGKVTSYNY